MSKFFCENSPIQLPEDIIPFLGKGERHWRKGRSAYELAYSWMEADGVPEPVQRVLANRPEFSDARLLEGHFERKTEIPGRGNPSQTDLLALCETKGTRFVCGVEGKVDETLGPLVSEWDNGKPNRQSRLAGLVAILGGDPTRIAGLRYQLLHRTASAVIEAKAFGIGRALMMVHSFDPRHAWFQDFSDFSVWLGSPCEAPGTLAGPVTRGEVELFVGWCGDRPRTA